MNKLGDCMPWMDYWVSIRAWVDKVIINTIEVNRMFPDKIPNSIDNDLLVDVQQQWRHAADTRDKHLRRSMTPDAAERLTAIDDDRRCSNDSEVSASIVNDRLVGRGSLIGTLPAEPGKVAFSYLAKNGEIIGLYTGASN